MTSELPENKPEEPQDPGQSPESEASEPGYLDEIRENLKEAARQEQAAKKSGWLARRWKIYRSRQPRNHPTSRNKNLRR